MENFMLHGNVLKTERLSANSTKHLTERYKLRILPFVLVLLTSCYPSVTEPPPPPVDQEMVLLRMLNHTKRGAYFDVVVGDMLTSYRVETNRSRNEKVPCADFRLSQVRIDRPKDDFSIKPPFLPADLGNNILFVGFDFDCTNTTIVAEISSKEIGTLYAE